MLYDSHAIEADPPFAVTASVDESRRVALVSVVGAIDYYTVGQLREQIVELMSVEGWDRMVLDLRGISFIDSAGLGVVVGTLKRARSLGKDLILAVTSSRVLRVFEIVELHRLFLIVDDPNVLE